MTQPEFVRPFYARWGDMDFNGHMKNTAYLDISGDVRMMYFQEHGFSLREFDRLKIGPVILRDELEYFRELRLLEPVVVSLTLAGLSADGRRFRLRNEFATEEGAKVARVTSTGGWLDLSTRRMIAPPDALAGLVTGMPKADDYDLI